MVLLSLKSGSIRTLLTVLLVCAPFLSAASSDENCDTSSLLQASLRSHDGRSRRSHLPAAEEAEEYLHAAGSALTQAEKKLSVVVQSHLPFPSIGDVAALQQPDSAAEPEAADDDALDAAADEVAGDATANETADDDPTFEETADDDTGEAADDASGDEAADGDAAPVEAADDDADEATGDASGDEVADDAIEQQPEDNAAGEAMVRIQLAPSRAIWQLRPWLRKGSRKAMLRNYQPMSATTAPPIPLIGRRSTLSTMSS